MLEALKLAALNMKVGDRRRDILCPFCLKELGSFMLTRHAGTARYTCFRASCQRKGTIQLDADWQPHAYAQEFQPKVFDRPLRNLDFMEARKLFEEYELDSDDVYTEEISISEIQGKQALHIPIHGRFNQIIAHWLKAWPAQPDVKKNDLVITSAQFIGLFTPRPRALPKIPYSCIVEDPLSAIKAANIFVNSWALLGTTLNSDKVHEIRQKDNKVVLALDPGTERISLNYLEKYGGYFKEFHVVHLRDDLKRVPYSELQETFKPWRK